jgi:multiple sugar transport system ATP-binding protein
VLQQIDTPAKLYSQPCNMFVAGFMGSPAMNFFNATLVSDQGTLWLKTDAFQLPIPPEQQAPYLPYKGQEVVFGIRPEHIHDPEFVPPGIRPEPVKATVTVTEMMGNEVIVYLSTVSGQEFVARVDPRSRLRVGQSTGVLFDVEHFHLFEKFTERTIT